MKADIAVVGAGPAGAWAAYCLARYGAQVLLIDPSHPREKPCGGGVTSRALELVGSVIGKAALPAISVQSARFAAGSRSSASVPFEKDTLVVASRTEFDGRLLEAARLAGARFLAARATDLQAVHNGYEIQTSGGVVQAGFVIGADGANSLVRRRLAERFRRDQLSIATGYFAHGASSRDIWIDLVANPPGYIWSFPRPTHLAIGICAQADSGATATALRRATADWIARTGVGQGARLEPYSWPIPSLSTRDLERLAPAGPRWCLVGDAAGLVDPVTREGIYFALLSAQWAADAIAGGSNVARRYVNQVREGIAPELARAARLKALFFRPRFARLLVEALRSSAAIRGVMQDLIAGRQDYGGLKWRLVKTLELGLATRLFLTTGPG